MERLAFFHPEAAVRVLPGRWYSYRAWYVDRLPVISVEAYTQPTPRAFDPFLCQCLTTMPGEHPGRPFTVGQAFSRSYS
ncbi:hypothetical protein [Streptomyces hydrogenans]|uniref:hypothetical protein n=1 Tax=Streptomyces hydrogenans TaxID=1873719 RepID=UPI0038230D79